MRRRIVAPTVVLTVVALVTGLVLAAATPQIEAVAVLDHIKFLASDEMRGRADGSPELERAGDYVAQQFKTAGLTPGGTSGGWFQPFELQAGLIVGERNALRIGTPEQSARLAIGSSYYPLATAPNTSLAVPSADLSHLPLVFAGYGISAPAFKYDDYAGLDVAGKAVLVFSHEPQENRADSRLDGARALAESTLAAKAQAATSHGARLLLVVSDPTHTVDQGEYGRFAIAPDPDEQTIPVLRVRRTEMLPLLRAWGLDEAAAAIDRDLVPRSRALAASDVDYTEFLARNRRTVRNVVGVLPGADTARRGQAIVIGGHYDHVGLGGRYSMTPERTGEIHNGADDNASGISAIIEMARAAVTDRARFPRTLIFVAFAGEELGLLGSAHYAEHPAVPLRDTVAMIDLDMVGRAHGRVETSGISTAPSLQRDLDAAAKVIGGIRLGSNGPGSGRSDDSSFIERRVPAVIFFTGFHDDYHRPGDDWDKIDAPGTARIAALALEFAARIAARPDRPPFVD